MRVKSVQSQTAALRGACDFDIMHFQDVPDPAENGKEYDRAVGPADRCDGR